MCTALNVKKDGVVCRLSQVGRYLFNLLGLQWFIFFKNERGLCMTHQQIIRELLKRLPEMTDEDRSVQRINFAYGELKFSYPDNPNITRESLRKTDEQRLREQATILLQQGV